MRGPGALVAALVAMAATTPSSPKAADDTSSPAIDFILRASAEGGRVLGPVRAQRLLRPRPRARDPAQVPAAQPQARPHARAARPGTEGTMNPEAFDAIAAIACTVALFLILKPWQPQERRR